MLSEIVTESKQKMQNSLEALDSELAKIRAGRAHPSLLDQLLVDYYGNLTPISQVANINASDARTLTIVPWEKEMTAPIERAIMESDLGLNPATSGTNIRLPFPPLTEDRRRDLVKIIKQTGEGAKISIRNARRDANSDLKELLGEKEVSEDEVRRSEANIQKLTDEFIKQIDSKIIEKESSLMEM